MVEQWPAGVPYQPLSGAVTIDPYRAPYVTEMEDGPRRLRRSTTKNIATMSFSLRMSYHAFGTFKPWLRDNLVDGTLPFEMPVWGDGGAFVTRRCIFAQPPRVIAMHTDYVDISVTVDVDDY